jgi:ribosomal-protein-alanine N-acetyltransferase
VDGKLSIREATLPLAPALAVLHAESFGPEGWSLDQMRGSLALTTTRGWIAYDGDKPAGFILCQMLPNETEILTFCVTPALRRQKIGEALLRLVVENAKADGGRIFLEVAADNAAARRLYEKLGFTVTGSRANYYKRGAVTVDAVRYERKKSIAE